MYFSIKKKIFIVFVFFIFILSSGALADLYQWQDEKGDIHVVDDILLVPPQYKDKAKILKARPPDTSDKVTPSQPAPLQAPAIKNELYGDSTLEWWKRAFDSKKREISELEKTVEEEKQFILDFERGKRLYYYRLYSAEDTEKYEAYKRSLPDNENQINKLKSELEELRRKAQIYGVPREVRE